MKEIVRWAIITPLGDCVATYDSEDAALNSGYYLDLVKIVKLTGTLPEQKKPRLLAPAFVKWEKSDHPELTAELYESEEVARKEFGKHFISWPAVANAEGFYSVEDV
jgi:hypothetical protein